VFAVAPNVQVVWVGAALNGLGAAGSGFIPSLLRSGLPAAQLGPAIGIGKAAGPIAINSLPPGAPGSAAHLVAEHALGSGSGVAFAVGISRRRSLGGRRRRGSSLLARGRRSGRRWPGGHRLTWGGRCRSSAR